VHIRAISGLLFGGLAALGTNAFRTATPSAIVGYIARFNGTGCTAPATQ
jgi:hypothetical protein